MKKILLLRWAAFLSIFVFAISGCTVRQYEISRGELERLSQLPVEERGERVLALQQTAYDRDALGVDENVGQRLNNAGVIALGNRCYDHDSFDEHSGCSRTRRTKRNSAGDDNADPSSAEALLGIALIAFAVTGVVLGPIAVTEGLRHDGWVQLPWDQPLFLVGSDRWVSLSDLSPGDLRTTTRAVAPAFGGRVEHLERRPLDRKGFAFNLEGGASHLPRTDDSSVVGYGGRVTLGGHPLQQLGFFGGGQFAYGSIPGEGIFLGKLLGSVEFLPAALGWLHAGVFAEGGLSHFAHTQEGTSARSGAFFSGGPLLQVALSTRLALTLRTQMTSVLAEEGRVWLPEGTFGFAVY